MDSLWGLNWCSLSRSTVMYLLDYIRHNPDYYNRFKYTLCSDELVLVTIVKNATNRDLIVDIRNALRFVEWNPKRESKTLPLLLDKREFDDVINSGAFFCRKLQLPESEKLVNMIDDRIKG